MILLSNTMSTESPNYEVTKVQNFYSKTILLACLINLPIIIMFHIKYYKSKGVINVTSSKIFNNMVLCILTNSENKIITMK